MTREDRFGLFLIKAISRPNICPKFKYYYDASKKILIRKTFDETSFNEYNELTELSHLSFEDKKNFLSSFLNKQSDAIKLQMESIIENFSRNSSFELEKEFQLISQDLAMDFFLRVENF